VDAVQDDRFALIYHNCGDNTPRMVESLLTIGAAAYHFGNAIDMKDMLDRFPSDIVVMGNVDPAGVLRMGSPDEVRAATTALLHACASYPNFVLSSGCDIPPMTPWDNIRAFFEASDAFYNA
jgi:uroporphyrinogen decarboxylase